MPHRLPARLSAAALLAVAAAARADELWHQSHVTCPNNPAGCYGGIVSQDARNPGGPGWMFEVADNFDAGSGWTITGLEFWGGQTTGEPAPTDGFMIRFYADNSGQVGPLLLAQDVFTFTQQAYYSWPTNPSFQGFHYTLILNQPFAPPAAGRYWMSIVAIQPYGTGNPGYRQWSWNLSSGPGYGPRCWQSASPPGNYYDPQAGDVAFALYGTGACYANCDGSQVPPTLNIADFTCFLQRFAVADPWANCDASTTPPVLNVADFTCFLQKFAAGCP